MLRTRMGLVLLVAILVVALTDNNEVNATPLACGGDDGIDFFMPFLPHGHKKHRKQKPDDDNKKDDDEKKDDDDKKKDDDDKDSLKDKKKKLIKDFEKMMEEFTCTTTKQPQESKKKSKSKNPMEDFSGYVKFLKFLFAR